VSGPLHPIPHLGPFEKWGINLMGPLLVTRRGHRVRQLLFFYSRFYKVTMLESTNATGEEKMQMYF
jgi:hypothetical protein